MKLNPNITVKNYERIEHKKASEKYLPVVFKYGNKTWDGWVPVEYRRTGVSIQDNEELVKHMNYVYEEMDPSKIDAWKREQDKFWATKPKANTTKAFYDVLVKGGWKCVDCDLPKNPNFARRIQDLKEFGYTLATNTNYKCPHCNETKTGLILLPIPRGGKGNGYETWSSDLRKRILKVLESIDVYENVANSNVLPDHKFSEIRWDENTKDINPDDMSDQEIKDKFQLLTNQRNQQKREVCRKCYQTGERGTIYGIPFFYQGGSKWDDSIPKKGKEAEKGCVGCPWYDIQKWRKELIKKL